MLNKNQAKIVNQIIYPISQGRLTYEYTNNPASYIYRLTQRELQISLIAAFGCTNKLIADELYLTIGTIKTHMRNILFKLQLMNRQQITLYMCKYGYILPEDILLVHNLPKEETDIKQVINNNKILQQNKD
jgi:DNA-binding NarL/FixJ family response regulator